MCGLKIWSTVHQLLGARQDLKAAAMFLFEAKPKGKNREPGLQENSVRDFTGRKVPWWAQILSLLDTFGSHPSGNVIVLKQC